jgi:TRAP-type C4-dicarboxylate transport system substrate-binding protein
MAVLDQPMLLPPDFTTWLEIYLDFVGPGGFLESVADDWNMQILVPFFWGAQHCYTNFGHLEDWNSFEGKTLRVWSVETGSFISTCGGNPVTIAWGEVFTALQTGLVDGLITSFEGAYINEMTSIAPYVTMASMQFAPASYYVNKDSLAALPADVRTDLLASAVSARDWFTSGIVSADGIALQEAFLTHYIKAQGIPKDFRQELREASYDGIWKPWMDRAGPEGVEAFNQLAQILADIDFAPPGWTPS